MLRRPVETAVESRHFFSPVKLVAIPEKQTLRINSPFSQNNDGVSNNKA